MNFNLLANTNRKYYLLLLFVLVVVFYPVVAVIPIVLGVTSTPISVSYRAVYLLIAIIVIVLALPRINSIKFSPGILLLILFFSLYGIRMYYDLSYRDIEIYSNDAYFYQYAIGGTMIPIIALAIGWRYVDTRVAPLWIYGFSILCCIAILVMVQLSGGILETMISGRLRVDQEDSVTVVGPIIVSREGGFLANLSLFYLLKRYKFSPPRLLLWLTMIFGIGLLITGASRGPLVASLVVVLLQLLIFTYRKSKSVSFWAWATAVLFTVIIPVVIYILYFTDFIQKLTIFNRFSSFSAANFEQEVRAQQWQAAWEQIKSSPIWGERMVENLFNHSPHNLFIEIVLALGIIGGLLFLGVLLLSLKNGFAEFRVKSPYFVIHLLLWLYLLYGLTGLTITVSPQLWMLLAAATYLSTTVKQRRLGVYE